MTKKELSRVGVIEEVISCKIKNTEGAKALGISDRQMRRLVNTYKVKGVESLAHKSRGRSSNNCISINLKEYAMKIIQEKYFDFGPTLAHEKLVEEHGLEMSIETIRKEMIKAKIWQPKARRKASIHQLRERRSQEGELVQIDGSPHKWFEDRAPECDLLVFIDDASGKLLWLEFVDIETTQSYFRAVSKYLRINGRPLAFYSDKHTVFRVNVGRKGSGSIEDSNGETQFGRAMRELDIGTIFANTPQAKGRVERANQTLQDRLIKEMRLRDICSIEEANKYLPIFMNQFNTKFSVKPRSDVNAHRPLLKEHNLEEILCLKNTRVLSKNLIIHYLNKSYQVKTEPRYEYTMRRARIDVIEKVDGLVSLRYKGKELKYSVIDTRHETKEFNSKMINNRVDEFKVNQGLKVEFNILGRTFLLWRKADISTLD